MVWKKDNKYYVKSGAKRAPKEGEAYLHDGKVFIAAYNAPEGMHFPILIGNWILDDVEHVLTGAHRPPRKGEAYLHEDSGRVFVAKGNRGYGHQLILRAVEVEPPTVATGEALRASWVKLIGHKPDVYARMDAIAGFPDLGDGVAIIVGGKEELFLEVEPITEASQVPKRLRKVMGFDYE